MAADLQTRAKHQPVQRLDQGYGWGRVCVTPDCDTILNHLNPGTRCHPCEQRLERERAQLAMAA